MKIAIIGAGNVGACTASLLISRQVCKKVALIDINKNLATVKAIDLAQMVAALDLDIDVVGGDDYSLIKDYDIVVITAGFARREDQKREDLIATNAKIVASSAINIAKWAPNSIIVVVTNPLDIMVYVALKASKFSPLKVIGMAGELDSARLKYEIASKLGTSSVKCFAKCVGTHNNDMICLESSMKFEDKSIKDIFDPDEIEEIKQRTKNGGANIVKLMGTSAFYAPSAGVLKMCESIKNGDEKPLSCSVFSKFGEDEVAIGRLVKLDNNGIKEILELNLTQKEMKNFKDSIEKVIKIISYINI